MINGKKASLDITILVFLIIILFLTSLYLFRTSVKVGEQGFESTREASREINNQVLLKNFELKGIFEDSVVKTYKEIAESDFYIGGNKFIDNIAIFEKVDSDLNKMFAEKLKENFVLKIPNKEVVVDEEELMLRVKNKEFIYELKDKEGEIMLSVNHTRDFSYEVDLNELGLMSFEEIFIKTNVCGNDKLCLENGLSNFVVEVEESNGHNIFTLTSKKKFEGEAIEFFFAD